MRMQPGQVALRRHFLVTLGPSRPHSVPPLAWRMWMRGLVTIETHAPAGERYTPALDIAVAFAE